MVIVVAVLMLLSVFYPTLSSPQSTLYAQKGYARISQKSANYAERLLLTTSPRELGAPQGDTLE